MIGDIISYIHKKWNLLLEYQVIGDIINIIKDIFYLSIE